MAYVKNGFLVTQDYKGEIAINVNQIINIYKGDGSWAILDTTCGDGHRLHESYQEIKRALGLSKDGE